MKARQDYFQELIDDVSAVSKDSGIQSSLILADATNGVRKALLDVSDQLQRLWRVKAGDQFPN